MVGDAVDLLEGTGRARQPLGRRGPSDVICEWSFHPDEIRELDFDPKGAIDFWDITSRQDWELSDLAQEGIGSRGYRPGPYSNREELLHALDRFVLGRLEGRRS